MKYEITEYGQVISHHFKKPKALKQATDKDGYKFVTLRIDGKTVYKRVHRLVAEIYIPNPEGKPFVNHIDGNPANNCVNNLEWVTNKENIIHAFKIGLCNSLTSKANKLQVEDVIYIKSSDKTNKELAELFGVSKNTISDIRTGKTWKNI